MNKLNNCVDVKKIQQIENVIYIVQYEFERKYISELVFEDNVLFLKGFILFLWQVFWF